MSGVTDDQRQRMQQVVEGLRTKSEKIRALDRAGFERSPIAQFLGIRYQHVRNVLVRPNPRRLEESAAKPIEMEAGAPSHHEWATIGNDGRVVIPAAYRRALGIEGGGQVLMLLQDGELRVVGRDAAVRLAQEIVAKYVPRGALLSDELIAERRAEAQGEGGTHGV